jgi:hypothetical protein
MPKTTARVHKKPHRGIEPGCGSFSLLVLAVLGQTGIPAGGVMALAAFSVFGWLEVMDFDLFFGFLFFLCFVLHITFQLFVVCVVSLTPNN